MVDTQYKEIKYDKLLRWKVLAHLILHKQYKRIAEIGVSKGDNARGIIRILHANNYVLDTFYLIDIPEMEQIKFYESESNARKFFHSLTGLESCNYLFIGSENASKVIEDKSLDLIYLDGNTSSYEAVKKDILLWLPKLKENGTMAGRYFNLTSERKKVYTDYVKDVIDEIFDKQTITLHALEEKNSGVTDYMWCYQNERQNNSNN